MLSTLIEAKSNGISVYHTVVVLNLSFLTSYCGWLSAFNGELQIPLDVFFAPSFKELRPILALIIFKAAHDALLGSIGIWLWHDVHGFDDKPGCTAVTVISMVGKKTLVTDKGIRIFWILFYTVYCLCQAWNSLVMLIRLLFPNTDVLRSRIKLSRRMDTPGELTVVHVTAIAIVIACTEHTISANRKFVDFKAEASWTFGQMLALSLVAVSGEATIQYAWKKIQWWKQVTKPGNGSGECTAPSIVQLFATLISS